MVNPEYLEILRGGADRWKRWLDTIRHHKDGSYDYSFTPELDGADLRGLNLSSTDFTRINLRGVDLRNVNLQGACFAHSDVVGAKCAGADLRGARILEADFSATDLTGANLQGAYFDKARLSSAYLGNADLTDAEVGWSVFGDLDLSETIGLHTVRHHGPSTIGVDTIYKSQGRIPEIFLLEAGVPRPLVIYAASLVLQPIQFYSCFISYAAKDQQFADRIHADLKNSGVRCWFAPHDVKAGRKLYEQIDEAIRLYDRLLLILSEHSMDSQWVKTEIAHAGHKEMKEKRQVLFPISLVPFEKVRDWKCFDADAGKDFAREIREYFIPDFSNWRDRGSYQQAFERLVEDLKAEEAG